MAEALGTILGTPDVSEALAIARDVCDGLAPQGRPLYAAHAELPWPEDDLLALWHAATLIREHRGDGHVSVLQHAGLDPVEATVLGGLLLVDHLPAQDPRLVRGGVRRRGRPAPRARLARRGRRLHRAGPGERQRIEDDTDRLAVEGWTHVGVEGPRGCTSW